MFAVLHLNDDFLPAFRFAQDVIDGGAVSVVDGRLFLVEELQVGNVALLFKQRVQEVEQLRLGELLSEYNLETDIGERIDKLSHILRFIN